MPGLQSHDDGGEGARCRHCGALAAGPCARCHAPVCGDCCVLTEGSAGVWAICHGCEARGGRSLAGGWWTVLGWVMGPLLVLAAAVALLSWWTGR